MRVQRIEEHASPEGSEHRLLAAQIERLDQLIEMAETRLVEQEAYVREVSLVRGSSDVARFELQRMPLLIALLREGRMRLRGGSGA